ncbi:MAG: YcgN family cysteine cluster protein [bacterium]|nr:YcgN family cysteine cluster protein [bacterium]
MKEKTNETPFWETKPMEEITPLEWESLCDGCGKCCLCKLQDDKTGEVLYTNIVCRLLDISACRCTDYEDRKALVSNCAILTPANVKEFFWLPKTCAYRLLAQGKDLYRWHPLVSGSRETVHKLGISVRNKVVSELYIHPDQVQEHIVDWE